MRRFAQNRDLQADLAKAPERLLLHPLHGAPHREPRPVEPGLGGGNGESGHHGQFLDGLFPQSMRVHDSAKRSG